MSSFSIQTILYFIYYAGFGTALALQLNKNGSRVCNDTTHDISRFAAIFFVYMAAYILIHPLIKHRLEKNKYLRGFGILLKAITQLNILVHLALFYSLGKADTCPNLHDVLRTWFLLVVIITLILTIRLLLSLLSYIFHYHKLEDLFPKFQNPIVWIIDEITNISDAGKWPTFITKLVYYAVFGVLFFIGFHDANETFCLQPNFKYFTAATFYFIYMAVITIFGHVYDLTGYKKVFDYKWYSRALYGLLFLPVQLTPIIYVALLKMSGKNDCSEVYSPVRIWFIVICVICAVLAGRDIYRTIRHEGPEKPDQEALLKHAAKHGDHHAILL